MNKMILTGVVSLLTICNAYSQPLTTAQLQQIREGFVRDAPTVALQNVITGNANIRNLALSHDMEGKIDHLFKYRVNVKGITDQKSSGRCWMFTSLNVLRPGVIEKYGLDGFQFSHNYLYFYDMLEKANLFLTNVIENADKNLDSREMMWFFNAPVSDGGVWNLYYNIAGKYGIVPAEAMPETAHSNSTSQMVSLINEKLRTEGYWIYRRIREGRDSNRASRERAQRSVGQMKTDALADVYRILALCLGEPPTDFVWRYKNKDGEIVERRLTPLEFHSEITPDDYTPQNYIMIMNDPTREYYRLYEIENYRNSVEGMNWVYLNLPNEDIKRAALASIKDNQAMYASCDVGKQHDRVRGVMDPSLYDYESLFGVKFDMDKQARILTRQSGSSHAMTLVGCDTDGEGVPVKWEFENSWGAAAGNKGYLTFTDRWFDAYMFRIVIHRKYLDAKAIESLGGTPHKLPMWDYMF